MLRQEKDLTAVMDAVAAASPEEISLARPQLYFLADQIKDIMWVRSFQHDYSQVGMLHQVDDVETLVHRIIDRAHVEGRSHCRTAVKTPGDVLALEGLSGALRVLGEAEAILMEIWEQAGIPWIEHALDKAVDAFQDLRVLACTLRDGVGSLYAEGITRHLSIPTPGEALDGVGGQLMVALDAPMTAYHLDEIKGLCGNWDTGRRIVEGVPTDDPLKWPENDSPLSSEASETLRQAVLGVLKSYQGIYHATSFVALLQQAAHMLHFDARKTVDQETVISISGAAESALRHYRKEAEGTRSEYYTEQAARPLEDHATEIAARERTSLSSARRQVAVAQSIDAFLLCIMDTCARDLAERPRPLEVRVRGDVLLFRLTDDPAAPVLAVYPDQDEDVTAYADRIYAARVHAPDDVPPSLSSIYHAGGIVGTNFRNLEDLLVSLNEPDMQRHFFGGPVVLVNAGDLVPPRDPSSREEPADAMVPF